MHWSLLVMKSFSFCMPGKVFTFIFEKCFSRVWNPQLMDFFFFQYFENVIPLSSGLHCFGRCLMYFLSWFFVFNLSFLFPPMAAFKIYFLIPALPTFWMEVFLPVCLGVCVCVFEFIEFFGSVNKFSTNLENISALFL